MRRPHAERCGLDGVPGALVIDERSSRDVPDKDEHEEKPQTECVDDERTQAFVPFIVWLEYRREFHTPRLAWIARNTFRQWMKVYRFPTKGAPTRMNIKPFRR